MESSVVNESRENADEHSFENVKPANLSVKHSNLLDEVFAAGYTSSAQAANHPQAEMRMFWPNGDLREDASRLEQLAHDLRAIAAGKLTADNTTSVELANWRLSHRRVLSLTGVSISHPTLGTKSIHTSEVYFIDLNRGIARTLSRWYRLTAPFTPPASTSEH